MKKIFLLTLFIAILGGCAKGQVNSTMLQSGQWTTPMNLGGGRYLVQGHGTQDAINGAHSTCGGVGRSAVIEQIIPSTMREKASVTFRCN
jgi:hypothetical protein